MALATQNANLVRQKAYNAAQAKLGSGNSPSPYVWYALKALFLHLAANKGNPDLQFLPFDPALIDTGADGSVLLSGAGKVYAIYAKRVNDVDDTDSFVEVLDDATDNSAPTTDIVATIRFTDASEEALVTFPNGAPFATGIVVSSTTTAGGTTESAATESASGFVIVAA
jgi:hypothetical protein